MVNSKDNFLEINIFPWYNMMHGQIENICFLLSKIIPKGAKDGIQHALKNRANSSIIAKKLSISYLKSSIPPINNQSQILPANVNLLFLNLLLLFFTLALAVKVLGSISNQGYSLKMLVKTVYGRRQRQCIAARLPRRVPKFPGRYFKTSWVRP
jgi:hypothetical protein